MLGFSSVVGLAAAVDSVSTIPVVGHILGAWPFVIADKVLIVQSNVFGVDVLFCVIFNRM